MDLAHYSIGIDYTCGSHSNLGSIHIGKFYINFNWYWFYFTVLGEVTYKLLRHDVFCLKYGW